MIVRFNFSGSVPSPVVGWVFLPLVLATACGGGLPLSRIGAQVQTFQSPELCESLGPISSGFTETQLESMSSDGVLTRLRNRAAEAGATHVLVDRHALVLRSGRVVGYRCEPGQAERGEDLRVRRELLRRHSELQDLTHVAALGRRGDLDAQLAGAVVLVGVGGAGVVAGAAMLVGSSGASSCLGPCFGGGRSSDNQLANFGGVVIGIGGAMFLAGLPWLFTTQYARRPLGRLLRLDERLMLDAYGSSEGAGLRFSGRF